MSLVVLRMSRVPSRVLLGIHHRQILVHHLHHRQRVPLQIVPVRKEVPVKKAIRNVAAVVQN